MTSSEFINKFEFPLVNFSSPVPFIDSIGFSVEQDYPNNKASLYRVVLDNKNENSVIKKILASANYGKKTDGGISLGDDSNLFNPVNLEIYDIFTYNTDTNKFYYKKKEIDAKEILIIVEKAHKKPTRLIVGLPLRIKLWFWRKALPFMIKMLDFILIGILWLVSGEKIRGDIWKRLLKIYHGETKEHIGEIEFQNVGMMEFFGYKAKRWSVVFYCLVHLIIIGVLVYKKINLIFLNDIFKDSFFVLCYVVVSFSITESFIPYILKQCIRMTPKFFGNIAFKRLKV